jgi:hypothetical protein
MTEYTYMVCPICGIHYAVDAHVMNYKKSKESGHKETGWSCPNGHSLVFRNSDADRLRRERDRLKQRLAERDDEISHLEGSVAAHKGQITKLKKRASAGICPCCNRSFQNLRRHMVCKHPAYGKEALTVITGGAAG